MPARLAKDTQTAPPDSMPGRTVRCVAEALQKHVKTLLREMVPNGEANSSQEIARMVLADLLQAMWARDPRRDTPTTVRGCIDIAAVTAKHCCVKRKPHCGKRLVKLPRLLLSCSRTRPYLLATRLRSSDVTARYAGAGEP